MILNKKTNLNNFSKDKITVLNVEENLTGTDWAVGDLHGNHSLLKKGLELINFDFSKDRLFCTGDLIDRGKEPVDCLNLLKEPWFYSVLGNHELFLIDAAQANFMSREAKDWIMEDGSWTKNQSHEELTKMAQLAVQLPFIITVGKDQKFHIVHAEILTQEDVGINDDYVASLHNRVDDWLAADLVWGRKIAYYPHLAKDAQSPNLSPVYCGHTIVDYPQVIGRQAFLDKMAWIDNGGICLCNTQTNEYFELRNNGTKIKGEMVWDNYSSSKRVRF